MSLPPFPVDDATLLAIEHALAGHLVPGEDGDPVLAGADYSLSGLLDFLSGYTRTGLPVAYGVHDVIGALVCEVRRLRGSREGQVTGPERAQTPWRLLCRLGWHRFGGWPTPGGEVLPYAQCARCGRIL